MEEQMNVALEIQKALGEAGGVAWCELYGHKEVDGQNVIVKINLTAREMNATLALESLINALGVAKDKYNMVPYNMPIKKIQPASDPFVIEGDFEPLDPQTAKPARPAKLADGESFHCVKFSSTVSKEGFVAINFYTDIPGKTKFPYLKATLAQERAMAYFRGAGLNITEAHLTSGQELACSLNVYFVYSDKLNSAGNPYKNITAIEAA